MQAHALVDELGNVLLGATSAKIEVTNWPSGGSPTVTGGRDSNGALVGTISREYQLGSDALIVRDIGGGILVELSATHLTLAGTTSGTTLYFTSNDCTGPSYMPLPSGSFYPTSVRLGPNLYYASAVPALVSAESSMSFGENFQGATCVDSETAALSLSTVATLDLTQFPPPYYLE